MLPDQFLGQLMARDVQELVAFYHLEAEQQAKEQQKKKG